jgi:hypothetical protein
MLAPTPASCLGEALEASTAILGGEVTGTEPSSMSRRTLRAGIIVGVVGLLAMLFTNLFMQNVGATTFNGDNAFFVVLTQMYLLAPLACLPFSAALISAALVMRHIDATTSDATPSARATEVR